MVEYLFCVKGDCVWQHSYTNNWHIWSIFYGSHLVKDIQTNQTSSHLIL